MVAGPTVPRLWFSRSVGINEPGGMGFVSDVFHMWHVV